MVENVKLSSESARPSHLAGRSHTSMKILYVLELES